MFSIVAQRMSEVREEQKMTIKNRVDKAIELAAKNDTSVYWVNFNDEGDLIEQIDTDALQIHGSMSLERKEDILFDFAKGNVKRLITKPKITAFGLNWQHCNHTVYFPTFSFEQYYQAIRRFWRFGQKRDVTVDIVYSDGQKRVLDALEQKTDKANELFGILNKNLNTSFVHKKTDFKNPIKLPSFLNSQTHD
jgi:superfamily II DNA/RNA helicase